MFNVEDREIASSRVHHGAHVPATLSTKQKVSIGLVSFTNKFLWIRKLKFHGTVWISTMNVVRTLHAILATAFTNWPFFGWDLRREKILKISTATRCFVYFFAQSASRRITLITSLCELNPIIFGTATHASKCDADFWLCPLFQFQLHPVFALVAFWAMIFDYFNDPFKNRRPLLEFCLFELFLNRFSI